MNKQGCLLTGCKRVPPVLTKMVMGNFCLEYFFAMVINQATLKGKFTIFTNFLVCRVQGAESNGESPRFVG